MDIRCPNCSKLFRVADEKIAGKGIRFKCSKCAEVITITKDDFEMDLLARDADTEAPVVQPSVAAPKPVPPPPPAPPAPQAEAREYVPPADQADDEQPADQQQIPSAALNDFDFSEPHEAAVSAAHPDAGFGGAGFSFDSGEEQDAAPEIEISPEAAAEAEAALQFPVDLISEPKRKPAFGSPQPAAQETASAGGETDLGDALAIPEMPAEDFGTDDADQGLDLGAALAIPKGTALGDESAPAATHEPDPGSAPAAPKGPVITPELLAQMKRNASGRSAAPASTASPSHEDMDLGAALAMPKTSAKEAGDAADTGPGAAASSSGAGSPLSGKRPLVIAMVALALVAVLGALYYLGFLWGMNDQEVQQKPQPKSPPTVRQMITPEGISIVDPSAFIDPERGDLVITGGIKNTTDKPKQGWYLVTEVRDAKEAVLTTVKMVNGVQLYSAAERDLLEKRGTKVDDVRSALQKGAIPAQGSVNFELRVLNPPAGSAGFLPMLRAVDPATLGDGK